jgi:hypothetical protein
MEIRGVTLEVGVVMPPQTCMAIIQEKGPLLLVTLTLLLSKDCLSLNEIYLAGRRISSGGGGRGGGGVE